MDSEIEKRLVEEAIRMREKAYAPYSDMLVGAAALGVDGKIYTGCNIENVSFSATNCAERTAIFKGVSEGCLEFKAIAITGGKRGQESGYCFPCGVCRQVMVEFADKEGLDIILVKNAAEYRILTLAELMPSAFTDF